MQDFSKFRINYKNNYKAFFESNTKQFHFFKTCQSMCAFRATNASRGAISVTYYMASSPLSSSMSIVAVLRRVLALETNAERRDPDAGVAIEEDGTADSAF